MNANPIPLRGTTVRYLEGLVRRLQERMEEMLKELTVADAALVAARKREEELVIIEKQMAAAETRKAEPHK